jgi:hypothetical protein
LQTIATKFRKEMSTGAVAKIGYDNIVVNYEYRPQKSDY